MNGGLGLTHDRIEEHKVKLSRRHSLIDPQMSAEDPKRVRLIRDTYAFFDRLRHQNSIFITTPPSAVQSEITLTGPGASGTVHLDIWRDFAIVFAEPPFASYGEQTSVNFVVETEKPAHFSNMAASLSQLLRMGERFLPGIRDLSAEEQKDLRKYYKKAYRKI